MQLTETSSAYEEAEIDASKEDFRFSKSLQELRDLRSQLQHAADYCQATFLNSEDKKMMVENTKEYICRAVVTLVDHLGNVSANLDQCLSKANEFSEAELRINAFKQRLLSCQQYTHKLALSQMRWRENLPRHHRRYLSTPNLNFAEKPAQDSNEYDTENVTLLIHTSRDKASLSNVMAVRDGLSPLPSKPPNPAFHFQVNRSRSWNRKSDSSMLQSHGILWFMRRARRSSTRN